jgi:hypothetical protein
MAEIWLVFVFWAVIVAFWQEMTKKIKSEKRKILSKETEKMNRGFKVLTIALVFTAMFFCEAKAQSLEHKLAIIDGGSYVSEDHITVARFRDLLKQLSEKYVENRQQIADMSVKAQQVLRDEHGIKVSLLNLMEGINNLFYRKVENMKYAEYAAAYMVLRSKGQTHKEAIEGLRALLQSLGIY